MKVFIVLLIMRDLSEHLWMAMTSPQCRFGAYLLPQAAALRQLCEKHLAVLSKGFQTYTVTDLLLSLLTKASRTWTGQEAGNGEGWTRSSACSREHMCGDDCPFLRQ